MKSDDNKIDNPSDAAEIAGDPSNKSETPRKIIDDSPKNSPKKTRIGLLHESMGLLRDIILIAALLILFGVFVAQPVVVEGNSMTPQLESGERLLVNKLIRYDFGGVSWGQISRGDIVVFWYPNDPDISYVKRIVGLPGETIEIRDKKVIIDGQILEEFYLKDPAENEIYDLESVYVKEHHYFVMGDNRGSSSDSRRWGLVPEKYIYGKAFFRYWHPANFGFLESGKYNLERAADDGATEDGDDGARTSDDDFSARRLG